MIAPIFREVGPYAIEGEIGRGGMAQVFLARDRRAGGRRVALKVLRSGPDEDARETAAAERRGAELQSRLLSESAFVPAVYEVGEVPGYFYIAMEYLEGEDLSAAIRRGPLDPRRAAAIAIQLCRFLEEVDHLDPGADDGSSLTLLHNDLKPNNVRLVAGDRVKVLDFGAAKALSKTRGVTRNDYYSTPYLSPECLESGERDRQTDAWALGVILYEMIAGRPPFRADDTRRLEDRIRSRQPPEPLGACPIGLQAIAGKLLAPSPADRFSGPEAIRLDLERFLANAPTNAEAEGWPGRVDDEAPTRRVRAPDDEPATRRVRAPIPDAPPESVRIDDEVPTRAAAGQSGSAEPVMSRAPGRLRRWSRRAVIALVLLLVANEACVARQAGRVATGIPLQDFSHLTASWQSYRTLRARSYLGLATIGLGHALENQTLVLAERVTANYRTPAPTVREAQWQAAARALEQALVVAPGNRVLRGTLRYAQGHLHRINGEAEKARRQAAAAQRDFAEALTAFREAASLRPDWPDPFLGLARTFIYGVEDVDRAADAIARAQQLGYTVGPRETAQLADGYRARGDALNRAATSLAGMPQQIDSLTRAREAYQKALELYARIPGYADVAAQIRATQRRLDELAATIGRLGVAGTTPRSSMPADTGATTPKRGATLVAAGRGRPWA